MRNFKHHGHSHLMWGRWEVAGEWIRGRVGLGLRQLQFDQFSASQANTVNHTHANTHPLQHC